ncbi:hypothetical protein [Roseovarius ramblicola]|uniref:Uncharacterized protein n=1 Tax=Roseovarius ramblicola TaxID=2022336 RepID=A0ABV5HYZ8_9RHOB
MDAAPNYTTAALVMGAVNLLWILMVIRAVFGFGAVVAVGYGIDRLIVWRARRRRVG